MEEQGQSSDGEVSVILQSTRGRARRSVLPPRTLGRTSSIEAAKRGQKRKQVDSPQVVAIHSTEALEEVSNKKKKKKKKKSQIFCFNAGYYKCYNHVCGLNILLKRKKKFQMFCFNAGYYNCYNHVCALNIYFSNTLILKTNLL